MSNVLNVNSFIGAAEGDKEHMLGKFLYFSLANLLVEKEALSKLCEDLNIPYSGGKRVSVADAFRSATGDIQERIPITRMGESHIYLAYCRDNKRTADILSRELVKETLNQQTNQYEKLANISYDKKDGAFRCDMLKRSISSSAIQPSVPHVRMSSRRKCGYFIAKKETASRRNTSK